jgi:aspartate kinase
MRRSLKVLKFGGSSLTSTRDIERVVSIIAEALPEKTGIIVVSALKGVTNDLVRLALSDDAAEGARAMKALRERHLEAGRKLLPKTIFDDYRKVVDTQCVHVWRRVGQNGDAAARDEILAIGERLSAPLLAACLTESLQPAAAHDAAAFIRTDSTFGNAKIRWRATHRFVDRWYRETSKIRVVTGFVGSDRSGRTTTLGRGGSDYSAAVLASVLKADVLERWTDVDGIYTDDPRVDPLAERLDKIELRTARDWNRAGRMGMHRKTLDPLAKNRVPIHVRSTLDPKREGTWILP